MKIKINYDLIITEVKIRKLNKSHKSSQIDQNKTIGAYRLSIAT